MEKVRLTKREREVLAQVASHRTYKQIAQHLGVNQGTVRTHMWHLRKLFNVHDRFALVNKARELGVLAAYPDITVTEELIELGARGLPHEWPEKSRLIVSKRVLDAAFAETIELL